MMRLPTSLRRQEDLIAVRNVLFLRETLVYALHETDSFPKTDGERRIPRLHRRSSGLQFSQNVQSNPGEEVRR